MKKKILALTVFIGIAFWSKAQNLDTFNTNMQIKANNYLSIAHKKAYASPDAAINKQFIDLALKDTKINGKQKIEWYNMSGKDEKIKKDMIGTATLINTISFDKDQFENCKTSQDLKRMTGHLTNNSFSHFASITDNLEKGITYHCFILQQENGKRALIWMDSLDTNTFFVRIKMDQ